ncbi:hypothetical protein SDC9_147851 [bioreactor metagenome]|uniref:Uncharacterized protein n=1 Tax=bioreactor metagenome TaxID=1076179 RepID=A0A645EF31_9ZZZZ
MSLSRVAGAAGASVASAAGASVASTAGASVASGAAGVVAQAARPATMVSAINVASSFFIINVSPFVFFLMALG